MVTTSSQTSVPTSPSKKLSEPPHLLHAVAGTPFIRLYPGSVQIGCDPGSELILTGLTETQERWLLSIASPHKHALASYSPSPQLQPVPPNCREIATQLVQSGYACFQNDSGIRLHCQRLEEPIIAAVESALSDNLLASFTISDPRCCDYSSWHERAYANGVAVAAGVRRHLERLFPAVSRPTVREHDLEIITQSLLEDGSDTAAFLSGLAPRLMVYLGQNSAIVGPLLFPDSPICTYCCAHWIHEMRSGIAQRPHHDAVSLPRLNPRLSARVTLEISDIISAFATYHYSGEISPQLSVWQQQFRHVTADGRVRDEVICAHPACGCAAGFTQPFVPLTQPE